MLLRQIGEGLGNLRQKFDGVVLNLVCETDDLFVKLRRDGHGAEPFEGIYESMGKAVETVSVLYYAFALDIVEDFADLFGLELVMVQEFNEACDGALKVDVVLPESVVGVDEESLHAVNSRIGTWSSHCCAGNEQ